MADTITTGTNNTTLPGYVAPYVDDLFARSQALTSSDPYQQYTGQRVAGLNDLQTNAANSVSGLNAGNLMTQGAGLTAQAGAYTPGAQSFGLDAAQKYMNPYQANVTDVANTEARRQADIQRMKDNSQAAQQGAFGGTRQAVVDAERERNLMLTQNNNTLTGQANAYTNAQQQFNADQNRQQADSQFGSTQALKAGDSLAQQGLKDFGVQSTAGMLQQQNAQQNNDVAYQDFLKNQQHPYDQLQFQRGILAGFPGSSSTTSSSNTAATNGLSNAAGLITAGKSIWDTLGSLFAKGGAVQSGLGAGRVAQFYGGMK
jgi:hypothetical protein